MIPLRPYQQRGVDEVRARINAGKRRIVFVLPTGGGKTVVGSAIVAGALAKKKRVLFVAHRRELIKQTFTKLLRNGLSPDAIGVAMAGIRARAAVPTGTSGWTPLEVVARLRCEGATDPQIDAELWKLFAARRPQAPVQVASVDSIRGKSLGGFDVLIIDEAHRSYAAGYRALIDSQPAAVILGLTATPYRMGGRGLGEVYEDLVPPVLNARQLAAEGFLVAPRMFGAPPDSLPDMSAARMSGEDWNRDDVESAMSKPKLIGDTVAEWGKRAQGLRTVRFAASVEHSREGVAAFKAAGVRAEHLDGATPEAERDAILSRLERGETSIVSNFGVLTEGWDCPIVAVAILDRPTASRSLAKQMMGRVLRPHDEKPFVLLLDRAQVITEHGGPLDEEEYSLDSPKKRRGGGELSIKTCKECFAIVPAGEVTCPECGYAFEAGEREGLEEEAGELVEIHDTTIADRRRVWEALCAERGKRRPSWVRGKFLEQVGVRAPKSWKVPLRDDERAENNPVAMEYWRQCYQDAHRQGRGKNAECFAFQTRYRHWPSKPMLEERDRWFEERRRPSLEETWLAELAGRSLEEQLEASLAVVPAPVLERRPLRAPSLAGLEAYTV